MIASVVAIRPPQQPWAIDEVVAAADTWNNSASTRQTAGNHFENMSELNFTSSRAGLRDVKRPLFRNQPRELRVLMPLVTRRFTYC